MSEIKRCPHSGGPFTESDAPELDAECPRCEKDFFDISREEENARYRNPPCFYGVEPMPARKEDDAEYYTPEFVAEVLADELGDGIADRDCGSACFSNCRRSASATRRSD